MHILLLLTLVASTAQGPAVPQCTSTPQPPPVPSRASAADLAMSELDRAVERAKAEKAKRDQRQDDLTL